MANIFSHARPDPFHHIEAMRNLERKKQREARLTRTNLVQENRLQHSLGATILQQEHENDTEAVEELRSRIHARSRGSAPERIRNAHVIDAITDIIRTIEHDEIEIRGESDSDIREREENRDHRIAKWKDALEAVQLGIVGDELRHILSMVEYEHGSALWSVEHAHDRRTKKHAERVYADLTLVRDAILQAYLQKES